MSALLAACASAGRNFDEALIERIVDGKTTQAEVREWFGEPASVQPLEGSANGSTSMWTYVYAKSFAGASTRSKSLAVAFDDSGVVVEHAYVEQ